MRRRTWGRIGATVGLAAPLGVYLHDNYPGLYVLLIVVAVFTTIWFGVRNRTTPEQVLEQHHRAEVQRGLGDTALLAELKVMFEKRACDWPMMSAVTHPGKLCPDCGHIAFHHDVPTKVCEKCHAPQG